MTTTPSAHSGEQGKPSVAQIIAAELARIDGYDPEDLHGGLYDVRWSGGSCPEPEGDAWNMDYLPKGERIARELERKHEQSEPVFIATMLYGTAEAAELAREAWTATTIAEREPFPPSEQAGISEIISDLRHSAKVDDYEPQQIAFLESIADRLQSAFPRGVGSGELNRSQPSASETPSADAKNALARIALTARNNMSPAHVLLAECEKIASAAIAAQRKEGE